MPIFPVLQTEELVQSGDKTRLDATQCFASGASELSTVSIRPSADDIFYNVSEDKYLDWVYDHSGGDDDPEEVVATVRACLRTVIDETNDKLDFTLSADPNTVITATVAHATYDDHVSLFAAVAAALNAATAEDYPDLIWSVEVDGGLTFITVDGLDVVSGDTVSFLPETGPNLLTSVLPLLGFEEDQSQTRLLIPNPGQVFSQSFASDVGFVYNAALAEFVGGLVRQKDQRPANGVAGATYTSSKNLNWITSGSLVATDIGAPVLAGGKLQCLGGGNNGVRYDNANLGASGNVGAMRIRYTPNYSGTPAANMTIFEFAPTSGNNDRMVLFHSVSGGTLRLTAYTSVGTVKHSAVVFGVAWVPVAGTEYELELNWDTVAGVVRLFVNGALQGAMPVSSYARGTDATRLYIGAGTVYPTTDASFNDALLFSTVQHTGAYVAGYTVPEAVYLATNVNLPNFAYTGVGTVLAVESSSVTESGTPRYTVGGLYWNGAAWVASNGTYAQANTSADIIANLPSINVSGATTIPVKVLFTDSNALSSVDEISVTVTGQIFDNEAVLEGDEEPADLHREVSKTIRIVTAETDNLFSTDANLVKHEWNILKFLPEGRASYKNVHREAQSLILAWLDTHGFVDDAGHKFTVEDIQNPEDLEKWATFMALRLIFESIHNAEDDVFETKSKKYHGLEEFYRNRANMRIDLNADGITDDFETLDTRSCRVVRR